MKKAITGPVKIFLVYKNSCEVLNKLKSRGFRASSMSTYDFSTLYTTLLHNLIKDLTFLLDNIYIRFGSKLYRQIVGKPMGTNCAPLVAGLFLFCYERDFMLSLSQDNQSDVIGATSRYLDDLWNINNNFFDSMVNRLYPSELQ